MKIRTVNDEYIEFEPDVRLPLSEALPLFAGGTGILRYLFTDEGLIYFLDKLNDDEIAVREADKPTYVADGDMLVYGVLNDFEFEKRSLALKETAKEDCLKRWGIPK